MERQEVLQLRQYRALIIPLTKNSKETPDKKQEDEKSRTSRSRKFSRSNKSEINKLNKAMKNYFTNLEEKIDELVNEH